ncbi:Pseudouridine-5'-phosphatase [Tritrichomonas musculus]|uniref:Pseudouridine-5'-phosphatase n=1 Tax=Tritrichomonas musculus TaxID=1915356 RepID=A0ABR2H082_9EUKA
MIYPHPIKAVIFDNDGVIVDSIPIYRQVFKEIIGFDYPQSRLKKISGRSDWEVCRIAVHDLNLPMTAEEFYEKRQNELAKKFPESKLIPGADKIVHKLKKLGLPLALATSGDRAGQILKATNHKELYSLFDVIICGDEVKNAKPSPEIFLTAAEKLGNINPENIIVIDDALNGMVAANKAKMVSIFLNKNEVDHEDPLSKPYIRISSLDDFDFSLFKFEP